MRESEHEDHRAAMTEQEEILLDLMDKTMGELSLIEEAQGQEAVMRNGSLIRLVERSERAVARLRGEPFCRTIHVPHIPAIGGRLAYQANWGGTDRLEYPAACFKADRWAGVSRIERYGGAQDIPAWLAFCEVVYFTCTDIFPEQNGATEYRDRMSPLLQHLNRPRLGSYSGFCCEVVNSPLQRCFRGRNNTRVRHWQFTFDFYQVDVVARKMWFPRKPVST